MKMIEVSGFGKVGREGYQKIQEHLDAILEILEYDPSQYRLVNINARFPKWKDIPPDHPLYTGELIPPGVLQETRGDIAFELQIRKLPKGTPFKDFQYHLE